MCGVRQSVIILPLLHNTHTDTYKKMSRGASSIHLSKDDVSTVVNGIMSAIHVLGTQAPYRMPVVN